MAEQEQQASQPEQTPQPAAAPVAPAQAASPAAAAPGTGAPPRAPQRRRDPRGGGGGGGGGGRGGFGRGRDRNAPEEEGGVQSSLVRIYRCSKVIKGGRSFSFGALVVAGDRSGNIGIGYGKANEVPQAVEKATKVARKEMFKVTLKGSTIPHVVKGTSGASSVVLVPARPGTGVTAGKSVRPCLELCGITDVLSKAYGSTSPKNLVKATMAALRQLRGREQVEQIRGVTLPTGAGEIA